MVEGADINEVLHDLPLFKNFIYSLYNAQYADFFVALGKFAISSQCHGCLSRLWANLQCSTLIPSEHHPLAQLMSNECNRDGKVDKNFIYRYTTSWYDVVFDELDHTIFICLLPEAAPPAS